MTAGVPELPSGVHEGDILAGKYRIERVLGRGGMGVVVGAHHVMLDERVAIKFLLPEHLETQNAVARFTREARAAVRIKSEHVARVLDVGQLESGAPYMVMEYLEGGDLAAWLRQRGPLSAPQAAEFVLQACEAIAEAHALGIVHRDLKPANLFCVRRPDGVLSVKVLDFGISKVIGGGSGMDLSATKKGSWVGSPLYMAPEQMQSSREVDARADIWALGAILYELLAGDVPFDGDTMPELVYSVVHAAHLPLREVCPGVPPELDLVVERCLRKDRARRYANVAELAQDLAKVAPERAQASVARIARTIEAAGLGVTAVSFPPNNEPGTPLASASTAEMASWGETRRATKRRWPIGLAATAAMGLCVAAAAFTLRGRGAAPAAARVSGQGPERASAAPGGPADPPPSAAAEAPSQPAPSAPPGTSAGPASAPPASAEPPAASGSPQPASATAGGARPASSGAPAAAGGPSARGPSKRSPGAAPEASSRPEGKAAPRCDPPYYFDEQSNRVFKKECL